MDYKIIVALIGLSYALLELACGRFLHRETTQRRDVILEVGGALGLSVMIVPAILWASATLTEVVAPGSKDALAYLPGWTMFVVLLFADDLLQYGWHRLVHSVPALFRFHRAHHSAAYLSVRCVYRNHLLYYVTLPGLWVSGVLLHLGFAPAYYVYFIAKMTVIIAAHSSVPWDEPLYRTPTLRPVMAFVARIISTPRTHAAHHGRHADDGVTNYKGNYGNFLFLWDVIFGTAKFGDRRPEAFGLENVQPRHWVHEFLLPFGIGRVRGAEAHSPAPEGTPLHDEEAML
ncbi:MAG: sterol desaturase family protein [Myxococcota bacterium]